MHPKRGTINLQPRIKKKCLKTRLSTFKFKNYIKTRRLLHTLTFWSISEEGIKNLKKFNHSFIDLGLSSKIWIFLNQKIYLRNCKIFTN